ncbi:MAG: hypothetical protein AABZ44_04200, partial [Elusimicrobiota bacterium]
GCASIYVDDALARSRVPSGTTSLASRQAFLDFLATQPVDACMLSLTDFELSTAAANLLLSRTDRPVRMMIASKETTVIFGRHFRQLAARNGHTILPVDSEPSAIFQCLGGSFDGGDALRKIILTATGGPFWNQPIEASRVTVAQALAHPVWRMGAKISVDSATLINKSLELMEINELFGVDVERIEILIHPECVIHSMVSMKNATVLAQMGPSDMRLAIAYALSWPHGFKQRTALQDVDFVKVGKLTFAAPDLERFPCLGVALKVAAIKEQTQAIAARAALMAADEALVAAFLQESVTFADFSGHLEAAVRFAQGVQGPSGDPQDFLAYGLRVYAQAKNFIKESIEARKREVSC